MYTKDISLTFLVSIVIQLNIRSCSYGPGLASLKFIPCPDNKQSLRIKLLNGKKTMELRRLCSLVNKIKTYSQLNKHVIDETGVKCLQG